MSALEKAISHSKKIGIDETEIVVVKKKITTVRITDSEIVEIKQNFDKNYGIRLIHNKKIISLQTTNQEKIGKSIDEAFLSISSLKPRIFWKGLPYKTNSKKIKGTFDKKLEDLSGKTASDIAQNMINSTCNSKIKAITGSLNIVYEDFELENSNGLNFKDKATYVSGIINTESEAGTAPVSGIGHACCRTLSNFLPEKIGEDSKTMCIESINPKKIDTGKYDIIFEPYSVGELLAFVIATNFNLKIFSEKKSCFSNNYYEKIAISELTLSDEPHIPEGIGTKHVDDEGVMTEKRNFIEKGVFKNTFSNLFDSYKEGKKSSGNACRIGSPMGRSSDPITISAPHNLTIPNGDYSQNELIKDTKHGLLIGRLWYTYAVNPIKGDFSCTARSGIRVIENGEIKSAGKSVRIIHNLPKMLKNISGIGNNQINVIQWASLPSITPSIRVQKIAVNSI
ncbi:MAG: TldD/PmbA family protein [Nitrosopumilus sp.]|uniref:TldD/PmbA family protein n=1 Tax=Nitrosopumilus sp. TaxID=2024843 RepID=UPI00247CD245|nr:TldD/PmbA family protein [Nitrosopumilus sp.]MCV0391864.1 TldD/PmbA family protein [Nitrosopumilus sp.]